MEISDSDYIEKNLPILPQDIIKEILLYFKKKLDLLGARVEKKHGNYLFLSKINPELLSEIRKYIQLKIKK